ncbi:MAG TPA: CARDB domain-containing protein [Thermoplasmata archaeon]|nr:CARDB domain-containing protein [Thermoplasmata archaeon]
MMRAIAAVLVLSVVLPLAATAAGGETPAPHPAALTSADVPTWLVGDAWRFFTHVATRDDANWTDMRTNLTVTVAARIQALQDGAWRYLYNATTAGDLQGQGNMTDPNSGSTVHFTIASATVQGYLWTERGDLAMARTNQTFSGTGTAMVPLFGSRPMTMNGSLTEISLPPEEDFDFPIEVQDTWHVGAVLNTTGSVRIVVDLPAPIPDVVISQPLAGDTPVDARSWVNGSETVSVPAGTFEALRIHSVDAGGGTTDRWYGPNASNYVRLETHDVSGATRYTHTWTNLTSYTLTAPVVSVGVSLVPQRVGPGGPVDVVGTTSAVGATAVVRIPFLNTTATAVTNATGGFRVTVTAPADDDRTPANTDMGSHGVLVDVDSAGSLGFGAATVVLLKPDLALQGLSITPLPVGDGLPTTLDTTVSVATTVPVDAPVDVTFVSEDVDTDSDGVMDAPIDAYCSRGSCIGTATVGPVLPGSPVTAGVSWTPATPAIPATLTLSAVVDPRDRYAETDEANNLATAAVRVEGPDLTPGNATLEVRGRWVFFDDPAALGFVSSVVDVPLGAPVNLTVRIRNAGPVNASRGTTAAFYNTSVLNGTGDVPFWTSAIPALAAGEDSATLRAQWTAPIASGTYFVNVTADHGSALRETSEVDNTFVFRMRVYDPGALPDLTPVSVAAPAKASVGRVVTIDARVRNVGRGNASGFTLVFYNDTMRASPFAVAAVGPLGMNATSSVVSGSWSSPVLGPHLLWVEVDYDNIVPELNETNNTWPVVIGVYDLPSTVISIGAPKVVSDNTYILPTTPLWFAATDRTGEGPPTIWYRVDAGNWTSIASGATITLPAGPHTVSYNSTDRLGGVEPTHDATVFVDDLPPETTAAVSNGTAGKLVTLTAVDAASGLDWTEYRIDNGTWTRYAGSPIEVAEPGGHRVEFRSTDRLGNLEATRSLNLTVEAATTPGPAPLNLKPLLALAFAAILALVGWFAAPSREPARRRRWLLSVVAPPAVLELATGLVSLAVPEMAVPGGSLGLPVDLAILAIGLLVVLFSRRRALRNL